MATHEPCFSQDTSKRATFGFSEGLDTSGLGLTVGHFGQWKKNNVSGSASSNG